MTIARRNGGIDRIALLSPAVGTGNMGDHLIEAAIRRLLGDRDYSRFSIRRPLNDEEIAAINGCRCAVLCGTNLFQHDWHSELTAEDLKRITVPLVPLGMGSSAAQLDETAVSERTAEMIRALHERCAVGGVRDPHTLEVVRGVGVTNVRLTGCPVLLWSGAENLPEPEPAPKKRIVVTARNWLMHRWPDAVDHPVQIDFLAAIFAAFPTERLVFAIHEDFDERLIDRLGIPSEAVFASDRAADYVALYTDPDNVVLAMRLHAGMLAVANGLPVVFVGHDTRTYSFCRMLGLDWVELFSPGADQQCISQLERLLAGGRAQLGTAPTRYRELHGVTTELLEANALSPVPARQEVTA